MEYIGFKVMILTRTEGGIREGHKGRQAVEDSDR